MSNALRPFGYHGRAELYYMNPAARRSLLIGYRLNKIEGQEEVNEMVLAHANKRTKICNLYMVGPEEVSIGFYSQVFPLMQPLML
jgi:hypothetical protein